MLKILAISDLHGKLPDIRKVAKGVDIIVSVGDFCSATKLRALEFRYWNNRRHWSEIVGTKKAQQLILDDIDSGREVLVKLNKLGKPVFVVPGNVDYPDTLSFAKIAKYRWDRYISQLHNIVDAEFSLIDIGEYQVIGYGRSSGPEKLGDKTVRKMIVKALASLFRRAKKPVIFLSHNVPYKLLDKISMKSSPSYGEHSGSDIAREMIERFSPAVCICGHMHETQGVAKLGKTTVINAGCGMMGQYAAIRLDKKNVKVYLQRKELKTNQDYN
ncbi:metallophosphoesterase [Candidatus Woesearchaeota archaeon]|nr:metallophosphoesterase [Candidatus Woesearchaeota archaeon]